MSTTQVSNDTASAASGSTTVPMRLEVAVVPVSDVDRAKAFYEGLGWRLDADAGGGGYRVVQMTPPGSPASIIFGEGVTSDEPGSIESMLLAVDDIDAARDQLIARGAEVSEVFHDANGSLGGGFHIGTEGRAPGADPEGRSYGSYASFEDPDGNRWVLQEITERLPGRVSRGNVEALSQALLEAAEHHDAFEKASPPHDWWDWYAAYMDARQGGSTQEDADTAADRYMAEVKNVVASR